MHPSVLAVTGPHATQEVMDAVHLHVPKPHDPFVDLVPAVREEFRGTAGIKLHLGCWHRVIPGFVHVDLCDMPHIDHQSSIICNICSSKRCIAKGKCNYEYYC
jgi:hypothetical protein